LKLKILLFGLLFVALSCSSNPELHWHQENGYRWAGLNPNSGLASKTGFKQLQPTETGIQSVNRLSDEQVAGNQNLLNGSGVAAGDIDGDGLVDLYFARLEGPNVLYKNLGGFRFKDITKSAGVALDGHLSTGVVLVDIDGDSDLDLLVSSLNGKNALYLNDGSGHFKLDNKSGLGAGKGSTTMALADIDGDGDLDLYIAHYKEKTVKDLFSFKDLAWNNTVKKTGNTYALIPPFDKYFSLIFGPDGLERRELGTKDELYLNEGDGTFSKTIPKDHFFTWKGKSEGLKRDWGLTAKFQDLNADGLPDLYVCNDFWTPDHMWINQGGGRFREAAPQVMRKQSFSSMGVDFSDINRDGYIDFFVTEMLGEHHQQRARQMTNYTPFIQKMGDADSHPQYMQNTLHLNRGDNTFSEIASYSGIEATGWSWATNFMDVDLDGYEDLLINTGHAHDVLDLDTQREMKKSSARNSRLSKGYVLQYPSLKLANVALRNNGNLTFSDKSKQWGFKEQDISHGMALADLDNDGDIDIATNRLNKPPAIYDNETTAPRIAVRLKGKEPNTQAIGAKVELQGGPVPQQKEISAGGSYLSGSDPLVVFAAKKKSTNSVLTVTWPNGNKTVIDSIKSNRIYEIEQATSRIRKKDVIKKDTSQTSQIFKDVSGRINYVHHEDKFNDFNIQPLLPLKLSRLGPGIAWIDYDQDGDDDLFIGSGRGGRLSIYKNLGNGQFRPVRTGRMNEKAPGDQSAIVGWNHGDQTTVIVGSSNYEQEDTHTPSAYQYVLQPGGKSIQKELPGISSTTGPIAVADYDSDGDLDLFLGGRFIPGKYPQDADSRLFKNESGQFVLDKMNSRKLQKIGLVTGAVFSDYDGDGDQDLILSREYGSILLFENNDGIFHDVSAQVGLDRYKGRWNGIATGDFNNDGYPDIVATNWGMNTEENISIDHPYKIFYDNFDRDQQVEIIEAEYDPYLGAYVPRRGLNDLYHTLSTITRNVSSYKDFARSSLKKILGVPLNMVPSKSVNTSQQMVFINKNGKKYVPHSLPRKSQFTVAFSAGVADLNNDGNEDIFLSQNLFALPKFTPRFDAGRGLWLQGDGKGNFKAVGGKKSGIKVYGEQRGAALADFNKDGKIDVAIAQNNAPLKLYVNRTSKVGITVQLQGPRQNKNGIGSSIRLIYKDGSKGPRREIQAGSGYWSQNSATQILGIRRKPEFIEVTWPNGTKQNVTIDSLQQKYVIPYRHHKSP